MSFRDALTQARRSVLERVDSGPRKLVFEWDLEIPWNAETGVTAGNGWRLLVLSGTKVVAVFEGNSGVTALNLLGEAMPSRDAAATIHATARGLNMKTIQAKCEVVSQYTGGQEVRFYVDSVCVKTLRLATGDAAFGKFAEGQSYDVEVADEPTPEALHEPEASHHEPEAHHAPRAKRH